MARRIPRRQVGAVAGAILLALLASGADQPLAPEQRAVIDHISADSLRGNLSFLASDLLEGRSAPSRGLDLAAEYIAAQFRRAGLEPAGDDGYFQTATLADVGDRGKRLAQSMGVDDPSSIKMRNVAGILRGSDPQMRDVDGPEARKLSFFLYEEIEAFRRASAKAGLTPEQVEDVFFNNARRLLDAAAKG